MKFRNFFVVMSKPKEREDWNPCFEHIYTDSQEAIVTRDILRMRNSEVEYVVLEFSDKEPKIVEE